MAEDGKIYITISEKQIANNNVVNDSDSSNISKEKDTKTNQEKQREKLLSYSQHQFQHFIQAQVNQAVNYSISNIGNFYGDYQAQRDTQAGMQVVNMAKSLVMSGVAGFKTGGVYGAAIAVGISVASSSINMVEQYKANMAQINRQNYSINQLKNLSGLNYLTNGSR